MEFVGADKDFKLKSLEENEPILVRVTKENGEPLTESEWLNTEITAVESEKDVAWVWARGTEVSTYSIAPRYYKEDMFKTGSGDVAFKVTMSSTEESFATTHEGNGTLFIDNDKTFLDVLKHYWPHFLIGGAIFIVLLGYVPGIKRRLPRNLKVRPTVDGIPKKVGRKRESGNGSFHKDFWSVWLPYRPETGTIKYLPAGVSGAPNARVRAGKHRSMILTNTKSFAGKKNITFDGVVVQPDQKKPIHLNSSTCIQAQLDGMAYTCIPNQ